MQEGPAREEDQPVKKGQAMKKDKRVWKKLSVKPVKTQQPVTKDEARACHGVANYVCEPCNANFILLPVTEQGRNNGEVRDVVLRGRMLFWRWQTRR